MKYNYLIINHKISLQIFETIKKKSEKNNFKLKYLTENNLLLPETSLYKNISHTNPYAYLRRPIVPSIYPVSDDVELTYLRRMIIFETNNDVFNDELEDIIDNEPDLLIAKDRQDNIVKEVADKTVTTNLSPVLHSSQSEVKLMRSEYKKEITKWFPVYCSGVVRIYGVIRYRTSGYSTSSMTGAVLQFDHNDRIVTTVNDQYQLIGDFDLKAVDKFATVPIDIELFAERCFKDDEWMRHACRFMNKMNGRFHLIERWPKANMSHYTIQQCLTSNLKSIKPKGIFHPNIMKNRIRFEASNGYCEEINTELESILKLCQINGKWKTELRNLLKKCSQNLDLLKSLEMPTKEKFSHNSVDLDDSLESYDRFGEGDMFNSTFLKLEKLMLWSLMKNDKNQFCIRGLISLDQAKRKFLLTEPLVINSINCASQQIVSNKCSYELVGPMYKQAMLSCYPDTKNSAYLDIFQYYFINGIPDNWQNIASIMHIVCQCQSLKLKEANDSLYNFDETLASAHITRSPSFHNTDSCISLDKAFISRIDNESVYNKYNNNNNKIDYTNNKDPLKQNKSSDKDNLTMEDVQMNLEDITRNCDSTDKDILLNQDDHLFKKPSEISVVKTVYKKRNKLKEIEKDKEENKVLLDNSMNNVIHENIDLENRINNNNIKKTKDNYLENKTIDKDNKENCDKKKVNEKQPERPLLKPNHQEVMSDITQSDNQSIISHIFNTDDVMSTNQSIITLNSTKKKNKKKRQLMTIKKLIKSNKKEKRSTKNEKAKKVIQSNDLSDLWKTPSVATINTSVSARQATTASSISTTSTKSKIKRKIPQSCFDDNMMPPNKKIKPSEIICCGHLVYEKPREKSSIITKSPYLMKCLDDSMSLNPDINDYCIIMNEQEVNLNKICFTKNRRLSLPPADVRQRISLEFKDNKINLKHNSKILMELAINGINNNF